MEDGQNMLARQTVFQKEKHDVYTCKMNKIALNRDDDKRLVLSDQKHTLARGHKNAGFMEEFAEIPQQ